jgi:hypothetical protein
VWEPLSGDAAVGELQGRQGQQELLWQRRAPAEVDRDFWIGSWDSKGYCCS